MSVRSLPVTVCWAYGASALGGYAKYRTTVVTRRVDYALFVSSDGVSRAFMRWSRMARCVQLQLLGTEYWSA